VFSRRWRARPRMMQTAHTPDPDAARDHTPRRLIGSETGNEPACINTPTRRKSPGGVELGQYHRVAAQRWNQHRHRHAIRPWPTSTFSLTASNTAPPPAASNATLRGLSAPAADIASSSAQPDAAAKGTWHPIERLKSLKRPHTVVLGMSAGLTAGGAMSMHPACIRHVRVFDCLDNGVSVPKSANPQTA
jgi:hypothetical protein